MAKKRDLSDAVRQALSRPTVDRGEQLARFGQSMAKLRDEAIKARKDSGIEDVWMYCEEAYLGIDDSNRHEFGSARWAKPRTMEGPLVAASRSDDGTKSTAFVRLTARYVDAGAAKIGEIVLPVDDKPFKLDPTPVPELIAGKEDLRVITDGGAPVMRPAGPQDAPDPMNGGEQAQPGAMVPLTVADLAKQQEDKAKDSAEAAGKQIYDWLVECKHPAQMRKVLFDSARLGSGVLKGPVPFNRKAKAVTKTANGVALQIVTKTVPVTKWIDLWNFFPAPDCGEDIHEGSGVFERDFLSPSALGKLKEQPGGYIAEAIDKVLKEGPGKCNLNDGRNPAQREDKHRFEIWYGYSTISRDELALTNPKEADSIPKEQSDVFAIVTLVNDTAIKAIINPLDSGSFPYHVHNWRRRAGHWAGVGPGEQCKLPQRVTNAATRALLNNAGQSSGAQTVIDRGAITPADGQWTLTPNKLWWKAADSTVDDVRKAFATFEIPNITPQLMTIIEYGFKLAEESTNIPLITQGQSGDTTPDTFGGAVLQNNNANQLLRDVGFGVADDITDPLVEQMYEWLLLDPDVPDETKGDFQVNCDAAAAMVERAIQDQTIAQMGAMVANPAFGIDPKRWFAEMAKTKRLDPRRFQYTEEEQKANAQNQPPPMPIAVAQVRAQSAEKIAASRDQATVQKMQIDKDRDTIYAQTETKRADDNAQAKMSELQIKREIANLDYQTKLMDFATRKSISLEQAKTELATTALKLNVQKELSAAALTVDVHKHHNPPPVITPPTEPAGRARNGQSFAE